jgi:hypothetical protein
MDSLLADINSFKAQQCALFEGPQSRHSANHNPPFAAQSQAHLERDMTLVTAKRAKLYFQRISTLVDYPQPRSQLQVAGLRCRACPESANRDSIVHLSLRCRTHGNVENLPPRHHHPRRRPYRQRQRQEGQKGRKRKPTWKWKELWTPSGRFTTVNLSGLSWLLPAVLARLSMVFLRSCMSLSDSPHL